MCLQPHVQKPLIVNLGFSIKEDRAAPSIAPHYPMALSLAQPHIFRVRSSAVMLNGIKHFCNHDDTTVHTMSHVPGG